MIIFYFSPNVDWEMIETTFGYTSNDIDSLTYAKCAEMQKFAFREWGGEIFMFTPETFANLFNDGEISDEGFIRIFAKKSDVYYQPICKIWHTIPDELFSFQAFASEEDCKDWLENNGYDSRQFSICVYHDDDIEDVTILDSNGETIEIK